MAMRRWAVSLMVEARVTGRIKVRGKRLLVTPDSNQRQERRGGP